MDDQRCDRMMLLPVSILIAVVHLADDVLLLINLGEKAVHTRTAGNKAHDATSAAAWCGILMACVVLFLLDTCIPNTSITFCFFLSNS